MVSRKLLGPTNFLGAQALYIHKTTEVIIIRKDKNLMLAAFQVMTPYFEGFDNSQKLIIVGFVSFFH